MTPWPPICKVTYNIRIKNMITLEKAALLAAIKKVLPGVEKGKTTIDGADQLLFTGTHVYSHNSLVAVAAPCDTQGQAFSVKGMDFFNWVSRINDLMLVLDITGTKVVLKGGRNKTSMKLMDPVSIQAYVEALGAGSLEFTILPEGFKDAATICMLEGNLTPLKGVAVGPHGDHAAVFSTDSDRICLHDLAGSMPTFWVDDGIFLDAFKVGDPTGFCLNGPWIHFLYADGTIFSAQVKECSSYPFSTCTGFVDGISTATVKASGRLPKDIGDAVSRVAILAGGDGSGASLVKMTFRKDELELHAEKDGGDATETIPWDVPLEEDPGDVCVYVTIRFLTGAANKTMDFSLMSLGDAPFLVFKSGEYVQMVSTSTK